MIDLNNKEEVKKIDPLDTAGTVEKLAAQCKVAWEEVNALNIPRFEDIENIVFCGMGASMYGAMVIKSLLGSQMPLPSEIVSDYLVPGYVNKNTLVVLTSYSGPLRRYCPVHETPGPKAQKWWFSPKAVH